MSTQIIRCPICLLSQPIKDNISPDKILHCGNCKKEFAVKNGLPLNDGGFIKFAAESTASGSPKAYTTTTFEPALTRNVALTWIFGSLIGLAIVNTTRTYIAPMKGPEFLFFYLMFYVGIGLSLAAVRKWWEDSAHVTVIALFIFEGVGLIRFLDASAAGMHKFSLMFIMMAVGAVLLISRYDHVGGNDWSDGSSCSSCSSCSGCGGGGGCGGCGD